MSHPTSDTQQQLLKTLRERAEEMLSASRDDIAVMSPEEIQALVHELQVHQMELEIQNEELRSAQFELAQAHDRYIDLYEFAPVGLVSTNRAGEIVVANLTATTLLGVERRALIGRHLSEFVAPDSQDAWHLHHEEVFTTGERQFREMKMQKADGTALIIRMSSISFDTPPNQRCRTALIDVTSYTQAKEQTRQILDSSPSGLIVIDRHGQITAINQKIIEMFGYERSELLNQQIEMLIPLRFRENHPALREAYNVNAKARPMGVGRDLFGLRKDGTEFPVEIGLNPINSSEEIWIVASIADITERKRAVDLLRESEARFRVIFEQAAVGVAQLDSVTGRYLQINGKYCEILGYTPQEMQQLDFMATTHPDDLPQDLAAMDRLRAGELREYTLEKRLICKDGSLRWVTLSVAPMWSPGTPPTTHIAVVVDITKRKRAEEQLALLSHELTHATRLGTLGQLASGLAHELNQPLTSLNLYAHIAMELSARFESAGLQSCLEKLANQSLRAGEIVRSMLAFSKRGSTRHTRANLNDLIREIQPLLEHELRSHHIRYEMQLQADLPDVQVDPIQIQQVFINLVRNAIEATDQMPLREIAIHSRSEQHDVFVSVTDTGCGLDPLITEKLFHPFQTTKPTGIGLGLAISRTLIEGCGGQIKAAPNPAGGTIFSFCLPALQKEEEQDP